jgi:putative phosphoribosyl transferase
LQSVTEREARAVEQQVSSYRKGWSRWPLAGRTALIVDDGIATGATARAACQVARLLGATRVVVTAPVAPRGWTSEFTGVADECVAVETPRRFLAVGAHYRDFDSTTDDEVVECLRRNLRK